MTEKVGRIMSDFMDEIGLCVDYTSTVWEVYGPCKGERITRHVNVNTKEEAFVAARKLNPDLTPIHARQLLGSEPYNKEFKAFHSILQGQSCRCRFYPTEKCEALDN